MYIIKQIYVWLLMLLQSTKKEIPQHHPDILSVVTVIKSSFEIPNGKVPQESIEDLKYYLGQDIPEATKTRIRRILNYLTQSRFQQPGHISEKIYAINDFYQMLSRGENQTRTIFKNDPPKEYPFAIN